MRCFRSGCNNNINNNGAQKAGGAHEAGAGRGSGRGTAGGAMGGRGGATRLPGLTSPTPASAHPPGTATQGRLGDFD